MEYDKYIIFVAILLSTFTILYYAKNKIIHHPLPPDPEKYERFYQKILLLVGSKNNFNNFYVRTKDNVWLDTIYIKNPETDRCIIFFHGNEGNLTTRFELVKFLYNYASVVIFDYRSYGISTGTVLLSDSFFREDAISIWEFTVYHLKFKPNNISFFGESFGCSIAIYLAAVLGSTMDSRYSPHSLICNAPLCSTRAIIESNFNRLNFGFFGKIISLLFGSNYQTIKLVKYISYHTKIIIAHSPNDEIVPYTEGLDLYREIIRVHKNSVFVNITGTHNNLGLTDQYIYLLADLFSN
ncbi:MAG: alpha/beta hydrolase [Thermoplasmata archaeon]